MEPRADAGGILEWLRTRRETCDMQITPSALAGSREWSLTEGRIRHRSGGFFSIVGARVEGDNGRRSCDLVQPIIEQPEIGLLGFITRRTDERLEVLAHAKPEPGNVGLTQLAPTVQATRSNYLRLHGGRATRLLEAFDAPTTTSRTLQSEQGTRFLGKYNDNVVVRADDMREEPGREFRWSSVDELLAALVEDFTVNTDARSVLVSCGPTALLPHRAPFVRRDTGDLGRLLAESWRVGRATAPSIHAAQQQIARARARFRFERTLVPVTECAPWVLSEDGLHAPGSGLGVGHVTVTTSEREVERWDQPLVTTDGEGRSTLLAQWHRDRLRFLFTLTPEIGLRECVQAHPTILDVRGPTLAFAELDERDSLLRELAADATDEASVLQSDEGGRFDRCVTRSTVAVLPEHLDVPAIDWTVWLGLEQIEALCRVSGFFTNESRSVLSVILGLA